MFGIFKEIEKLKQRMNDLEVRYMEHDSKLVEFDKKLNSREYNDVVDRYKAKEKRLYKKAVEIILSGEKPTTTINAGFPSSRTIEYKNLYFYMTFKNLMVTYKNFTFNEENSKLLYDLYKSLNCLR